MFSKFLIFSSISSAILNLFTAARNTTTRPDDRDEVLYNHPATTEKKLTFVETVFDPNSVGQTVETNAGTAEYEVPFVGDDNSEATTNAANKFAEAGANIDSDAEFIIEAASEKVGVESLDNDAEAEANEVEDDEAQMTKFINGILDMIPEILEKIKNNTEIEEAKRVMGDARKEWNDARTQCAKSKYSQECKATVYEKQKLYRKAEWTVFDSVQKFNNAVFDLRQFSDDFVQRHSPKLISEASSNTIVFFDQRNRYHIVEKNGLTEIANGVALKL